MPRTISAKRAKASCSSVSGCSGRCRVRRGRRRVDREGTSGFCTRSPAPACRTPTMRADAPGSEGRGRTREMTKTAPSSSAGRVAPARPGHRVARARVRSRVRAAVPPPHERRRPLGRHRRACSCWSRSHQGNPTDVEENLFKLVNGLPDQLATLFTFLYRFGALWALALIVLAAVVARRRRLGRDLLVAGLAAWALGRIIGALVVSDSEHPALARRRHPLRRRRPLLPGGAPGGDRGGHLGGRAVPHATRPPDRPAPRAGARVRVALPRDRPPRRRVRRARARLGGGVGSSTSRSGRPADGRRAGRSRSRSRSSVSVVPRCTCAIRSRAPAR